MSKFYLCGDTHGLHDINKLVGFHAKEGENLTRDDYVIVLGDFGIWSNPDHNDDMLSYYNWFPWTTLFVDGNHDNHDLIEKLDSVQMFGADVGCWNENVYHLRRGRIYTFNGKKFFVMGGGYSIDKDWRTPGISWWHQEIPSIEEFELGLSNLRQHDMRVDHVLTHSPPRRVIQYMEADPSARIPNLSAKIGFQDACSLGLDEFVDELSFDSWHCGHMHVEKSYTIEGKSFVVHYNGTPCRIV